MWTPTRSCDAVCYTFSVAKQRKTYVNHRISWPRLVRSISNPCRCAACCTYGVAGVLWGGTPLAILLDNKANGSVAQALVEHLQPNSSLSILSNAFSIYAFASLREQWKNVDRVRLLLPVPVSNCTTATGISGSVAGLQGDVPDRRFRNSLLQPRTALECAEWIRSKVEVRRLITPLPQNLICLETDNGTIAVQGTSAFTTVGLGLAPSSSPSEGWLRASVLRCRDEVWSLQ